MLHGISGIHVDFHSGMYTRFAHIWTEHHLLRSEHIEQENIAKQLMFLANLHILWCENHNNTLHNKKESLFIPKKGTKSGRKLLKENEFCWFNSLKWFHNVKRLKQISIFSRVQHESNKYRCIFDMHRFSAFYIYA